MIKKFLFPMVVVGILIILMLLYVAFGHLKHEQEETVARYPGTDEFSQSIRVEADAFRILNRNAQRGILATGAVVVLVTGAWWVGQRMRKPELQDVPK